MTCSLYMSSAVWRFMTVSPALKTERRVVPFMELWMGSVDKLKIQLKAATPLVTTKLYPNLI